MSAYRRKAVEKFVSLWNKDNTIQKQDHDERKYFKSNPWKNKKFANYYQPVRIRPFIKLIKHLNYPTKGQFVDIGSGKGKALIFL